VRHPLRPRLDHQRDRARPQRAGSHQKKLTDAARHWAAARAPSDKPHANAIRRDLERQGLPAADIERIVQAEVASGSARGAPALFDVLRDNWPTVEMFLACQTQWEIHGFSGHYLGLRYEGLESAVNLMEVKHDDRRALFEQLRLMELAALEIINTKR